MKKFILLASVAVLCCGIVSESQADIASSDNCDSNFGPSTVPGPAGCSWKITDNGVLIIKGSGDTPLAAARYNYGLPWEDKRSDITAVVFDNIVGNYSFGDFILKGMDIISVNGGAIMSESYVNEYLNHAQKQPTFHDCGNTGLVFCLKSLGLSGCKNGEVLQEGKCVTSCGENFKLNDGECDRIRYTPAEAAPLLNDDDNFVILTFKK